MTDRFDGDWDVIPEGSGITPRRGRFAQRAGGARSKGVALMYGDHKRRVYVSRRHIIAAATALYAYGPSGDNWPLIEPRASTGHFACRCPIQRALDAKYQSSERWTVYSDEAIGDGHHWTLDRAGRNLVWQFDTEFGATPRHVRLTA